MEVEGRNSGEFIEIIAELFTGEHSSLKVDWLSQFSAQTDEQLLFAQSRPFASSTVIGMPVEGNRFMSDLDLRFIFFCVCRGLDGRCSVWGECGEKRG
ncbi:MAG: hypothetical protein R3C11_16870 [Planctomycetaceae bacterium]